MGRSGIAYTEGNSCVAAARGSSGSASVEGKDSVAMATGEDCKAKGLLGSAICVVERGEYDSCASTYPLLGIKAAMIDGEILKPNTWYTLKDGEFVEVE